MGTDEPRMGTDPAARHRAVAAGFDAVVAVTGDWEAATPVDGWVARDVVGHLVGWFPAFLAAGGVALPAGPAVADDPVGAWRSLAAAVQALLDDPTQADRPFTHPFAGTHRLADAIDRFFTADVFMHTWDLARAAGVPPSLDVDYCATLLEGLVPIEAVLRSSGHYGPAVEVPADADAMTRLVAFIGRDPSWRPPS